MSSEDLPGPGSSVVWQAPEVLTTAIRSNPQLLYGRQSDLRFCQDFLIGPQSILVITGGRRTGKSSLAQSLLASLASHTPTVSRRLAGAIPIFISLDGLDSLERLGFQIAVGARSTWTLISKDPIPRHVISFENRLASTIGIDQRRILEVGLRPDLHISSAFRAYYNNLGLAGVLDGLAGAAKSGRTARPVVIVLDEVQNVLAYGDQSVSEFLEVLKRVNDSLPQVKIVLTGSEARLLDQVFRSRFQHLFYGRATSHLHIEPLDSTSSKQLLRSGLVISGVPYSESVLDEGYLATVGVAGGLIRFANTYIETILRDPKHNVRAATQRAATDAVRFLQKGLEAEIENLVRVEDDPGAGPLFQKVASVVARSPSIRTQRIATLLNLPVDRVGRALDRLELYEVLVRDNSGQYSLGDKAFASMARLTKVEWRVANGLFEDGNYQGAIKAYTDAILSDPTHDDSYFNRALSFRVLGLHYFAICDLEEVTRLTEPKSDALLLLGDIFETLQFYEDAMKAYTDASAASNASPESKSRMDRLRGMFEETTNQLRHIRGKITPKSDPNVIRKTIYDLFNQARYAEAAEVCDEALGAFPSDDLLTSVRADIMVARGHPQDAVPIFQDLLNSSPDDVSYPYGLANAQLVSGMLSECLNTLERAVVAHPSVIRLNLLRAVAIGAQDRPEAGLASINAAIASGTIDGKETLVRAHQTLCNRHRLPINDDVLRPFILQPNSLLAFGLAVDATSKVLATLRCPPSPVWPEPGPFSS